MTNPNNAVRVSSRNGGRGSVYEANAWAQLYNNGILSGNGVTPDTGMVVQTGGTTACPDVLIATNASGYRIALDVVDTATLTITKPASNKRITAIVAYTDDLAIASTESNITGNPASCGLIAVDGTTSANPVDPTDAQIRTAITSDGGSGSQAAYAIIATILVTSSTASITSGIITRKSAYSAVYDPKVTENDINWSGLNMFHHYNASGEDVTVAQWTKTTIETIAMTGLAENATYLLIANVGFVSNKAYSDSDILLNLETNTTGAAMTTSQDYSVSLWADTMSITGFVSTGSNTSVNAQFKLTATAGTYHVATYDIMAIRVG